MWQSCQAIAQRVPASWQSSVRNRGTNASRRSISGGKFGLSFELFPPKTPAGEQELFRHLVDLVAFEPSYITCTYGALARRGTRRWRSWSG